MNRLLKGGVFALLVTALASSPLTAQDHGAITGIVTNSRAEPLSNARVDVEGTARGGVTDARGRYRIEGLAAGRYVVVARRIGQKRSQTTVSITGGQITTADFSLTDSPILMSEIVTSATREEELRTEVAATISQIGASQIDAVGPAHPADLLNSLPGVYVNQTSGEGSMVAIRQPQTTDPVYLFLEDGIPTRSTGFFNHNALYEVNVPQAGGIEVTKGPSSALYGSDAIGGVINVTTRAPSLRPQFGITIEGGEDTWGRILASGSNSFGANGVRADLNLTRTDGWRQGTDYDRQSATIRWDRELSGSAQVKTVLTYSNINQQTAGSSQLSEADFNSNPELNTTPVSFRDVKAFRASAAFEINGSASNFSVTPFFRFNSMDLLPNWSLTFDPAIWETQNFSTGFLTKYRIDFESLRGRLIAGLDLDLSPGERLETAGTPLREAGIFTQFTPTNSIYDYDVTFREASPYVQAEFSPTHRLRVTTGLRADFIGYDYTNNLSDVTTGQHRRPSSTTVSYEHLSPKAGVTYRVSDAFNLFGSYRHGFRSPSEGQLFRQGSSTNTVDLDPVKVNSFETGARGLVAGRLSYDVSAYYMTKTDDIVRLTLDDGTRQASNAGETLHRGIEIGVASEIADGLSISGSYSYQKHTFEDWRPTSTLDFSGNEIQSAPQTIAAASLNYSPTFIAGLDLSAEVTRVGSYWLDEGNTEKYAGHNLLNLRGSFKALSRVTVFARLLNATNKLYAERGQFTGFRGIELAPGRPRTLFVGLQY